MHAVFKNGEEQILYAQIESFFERKDYQRKGRCVRLTAISEEDFTSIQQDQAEGITAITVDVSYWAFFFHAMKRRWITKEIREQLDSHNHDLTRLGSSGWYRLHVSRATDGSDGYAYQTFSEGETEFFSLLDCRSIPAPKLPPMPTRDVDGAEILSLSMKPLRSLEIGDENSPPWELYSFHVGQGMCSLLSNGRHGILIDAGAGKPIIFPAYKKTKTPMRNDLKKRIANIEKLDMVLSHADHDHWNLLSWDATIRKKIQRIFVPENTKAIALMDKLIINNIRTSHDFAYICMGGGRLEVLRSSPSINNDNTDCLVAVYVEKSNGQLALMPGDYVYEDIRNDTKAEVKNLASKQFDAIVVPHHGDQASAINVFNPLRSGASIAFFSAGENQKYNHPTTASLDAHKNKRFQVIEDHSLDWIKEVRLLP